MQQFRTSLVCGLERRWKVWHPSGSTVQSLVRSAATNPARMFTSCLFNSINGPLILASYSHEMRRQHLCRAVRTGRDRATKSLLEQVCSYFGVMSIFNDGLDRANVRGRCCSALRATHEWNYVIGRSTGPSTRCRRRGYEGTSSTLGRRSPSPRNILCNGGLPDIDAELEKLAMNSWCAPQWVGEIHLANETTDFQRGLWTATARSSFPAPIRSEAGTMPTDHGLRPDDLQSVHLTAQTEANQDALGRLLAALSTVGICTPSGEGRYALTELGASLDGTDDRSLKGWVIFEGQMLA